MIVPNTLAQTVMIERGVLRIEDGRPVLMPVPATEHQKAGTLSEAMFYEALAKVDPGLPAALHVFEEVEPLGVYPDLKASLNLKVDLPDHPKPINLGYIAKNGQLWTNPFSWAAQPIARTTMPGLRR